MSEAIVELRNLSKRYDAFAAVDSLSMTVRKGEFVVLLGPSGSGKTTLLSMLGGFTEPTSGELLIAGKDMTHVPPARRPTVTVFQDYALFPHMTVRENVAFGLAMRHVPRTERRRQAEAALDVVGLKGFEDRRIHQLSGGQRQRVALARAIVIEPAVLLLDEPLGALDVKIRRQMQDELLRLQRRLGTTFIHVTHDQEEAMSIADTIVLLNAGRIEDMGPPERIYRKPASVFAATFMGETNLLEGRVAGASGGKVSVDTPLGSITLEGGASPGEAVSLSVRPESMRIGAPPSGDTVSLGKARLGSFVFQGTHRRCQAAAGPGGSTPLLVRLPPELPLVAGSETELWTRSSDIVLLRAGPS